MIIAEKEQEIKEHDNIRMTLRQSIRDLKDQLERRQEEILAGVEGILALGYAGCSYDTDGSATKRILGCVYQMIEPYCDMTYITPPPF
ncbi:hypothetical protein GBF38_020345 [Nibea albiflora]|uniref:Uncharacterized protein n=1 Tax=Nibea albiflora TaxID=240163 RepID=A0ACB7FHJ4_NIBAL|nr:hypothetical protein GBF38_020345 [Nibea albiflora]